MAQIDAVLQELDGGVYDIQIDDFGDIGTADFFDTAIQVSLLSDKRADASEVLDSSRRRGWVGNEARDDGFEIGSKLWLFDQSRLSRTVMNAIEDAARESLQWLVDDGFAIAIRTVDLDFATPNSPVTGVTLTIEIQRSRSEVDVKLFNLWQITGVSSQAEEPPFEAVIANPNEIDPQEMSLEFPLGTSQLRAAAAGDVDIANQWSVAAWVKRTSLGSGSTPTSFTFVMIDPATGLDRKSGISLICPDRQDTDFGIHLTSFDNIGQQIVDTSGGGFTTIGDWVFLVATYDGTQSAADETTGYVNAVEAAMTGTEVDSEMRNEFDRRIMLGQAFVEFGSAQNPIFYYSVGIWNRRLTQTEIDALYNAGNPKTLDYNSDFENDEGVYLASLNLKAWYRLGFDPDFVGKNYAGVNSNGIDLTFINNITLPDDISTDFPGV